MDEMNLQRTRIAPTPSGYLHRGNGFSFVLTALLARKTGAKLLLRIDDLDRDRYRPEYLEDIFVQLDWLGIRPDEGPTSPDDFERNFSQLFRIQQYRDAIGKLQSADIVYACSCSRKQFAAHTGSHCTCYDANSEPSVPYALRLKHLPQEHILCDLDGTIHQLNLAAEPGPIPILQKNAHPSYQVASVIDDLSADVDFIVRGADLLPSSGLQQHLANVLQRREYTKIAHQHHALIFDRGQKMSKSAGSTSLRHFANEGGSQVDFYRWFASILGIEPAAFGKHFSARACLDVLNEKSTLNQLLKAGKTAYTP